MAPQRFPGPQPGQHGAPPPAWQNQFATSSGGGGKSRGTLLAVLGGAAVLVIAVIVVLALVLGGGDGPGETVEEYFDGVVAGDCDTFDLLSDDLAETVGATKKDCEDAGGKEFLTSADVEGCDIEVIDESEDGAEATVEYEITGCNIADNNDKGSFRLVDDGGWKIDEFPA